MKIYKSPFLSRALSSAIFSCLCAAVSLNAAAPVIDSAPTDSVVVDQTYDYTITATNTPTTYGAPGLPSGLSHDDNSSGAITGSLSQAGVYDITLFVQNADGFDQQTLVLTVTGAAITSPLNETAIVGEPYSYQITANFAPTSYLLIGLDDFPGLSYDSATGLISGTPTEAHSADIIVQAFNSPTTATALLVLTVDPAPVAAAVPVITSALTVSTTKGVPFSYVITGTNSPFSFANAGDPLPTGLSRSGNTISGTPTETGVFNIDISATNEFGTGSDTLELTVVEPAPVITSVLLLGGEVNQSFTYQITADNTPLSFDAFGLAESPATSPLIPGLWINRADGVIWGAPTVSGDFDVTITATNAAGTDTASLRIIVIPATGAGEGPNVEIITINGEDPLTNPVFDADTATLTIVAEVEPDANETLEAVFVRWNNPPATAGGAASIVAELLPVEPIPATGPITFSGTVTVGFSPSAREIGGGAIDLEVVATQRSSTDVLSFGSSPSAMIEIAPLVEFLFPSEDLVLKEISVGEVFASVQLGTNAFQTITASISGVGVIDTIIDDDSSDNPNGIFNFLAETPVTFPGAYTVDIVATDSLGNTTSVTQSIVIDNAPTGPVVSIASPTPGFTNEVFSPAIFTWEENGAPALETADDGTVITTTYTYVINQVTEGIGYYPRNATGVNIIYNFLPGGASVGENTIVDGRLPALSDSLSIVFDGESNGYGSNGTGVVDNAFDPGQPAQITLAAEFFQGDADLVSFKMFVNGADLTPGNGNLDPNAGQINAAVIDYPSSGSPAPGNYVVTAQVTDRSGNVATSAPRSFQILPYEPLEISLARLVGTGADPSDPILIGGSATFIADVSPIDQVQSVEIFESNSGVKLGDASRVQIDGNLVYRSSIIFNETGAFKVFAKATSFNGLTVSSAPVDLSVIGGEFPEVEITSPLGGDTFTAGDTLTLRISATDADGAITTVEIFDGATLLDTAVPSGVANEYLFNLPTSSTDLGVYNFIARATDDRGNLTDSDVVVVGLVQGDVPLVTLLEPNAGDSFKIGQPFLIRVTATDADGIITSVVARDISRPSSTFPFNGLILNATQNPGEYVVSPTPSSPEVVDLIITATDDDGNQVSTVPVQFTITSGIVPAVSIDSPLDGDGPFNLGDAITVEMTASDIDGSVTQVELFNGAASLGLANLTGANTYRFDYPASAPGLVNLQARATDDSGNVGISDLVSVSVVTGDVPEVVIDNPVSGDSIKSGETLQMLVSVLDGDGFITKVEIFNNDNSLGLANPTGAANEYAFNYSTSSADLGTLNLQARGMDNQGNLGFSDVVNFSVVSGAVPVVSIDSPLNGEAFLITTPITLDITATDGDDSIVSVELFSNDASVGFASSTGGDQYQFVLTETGEAGLQRLTAVATDELGNSTTSLEVNVLLTSGVAPEVIITSPAASATFDLGSVITVEISASDIDGGVTQVEVFNGAVSLGLATLVGADTYRFDYQASSPGGLNLQARATDDLGNISFSDLVPVSVVTGAIPTVTIDSPSSGISVTSGKNVEILVTAKDADGQVTAVGIFEGLDLLGFATPTGNLNEYRYVARTLDSETRVVGNFNLQARVVDDRGNIGFSERVTLSVVLGAVPQIEILSPLPGDSFFTDQPFIIRARITDADGVIAGATLLDENVIYDPAGTDAIGQQLYVVRDGSRSFDEDVMEQTSTPNEYQFIASGLSTADLVDLVITATDDDGNFTKSSPVQFTVTSGIAPDVAITSPLTGASYTRGDFVTIDIDASDQDGTISQVEVFNGAASLGIADFVSAGTYRLNYAANAVGNVNLIAQATDDLGNVGISNIETITIVSGAVPTVGITLPNGISYTAGAVITIDVSADDADGFVTSVAIYDGATEIGTASKVSDTEYRLNLSTSLADVGLLELNARATDDSGNVSISDLATVSVTTGAVPTVAITSPADGISYTAGAVITIDVSADDADGQVTSVAIYDGATSALLGQAYPTGISGEYQLNYLTGLSQAGLLSLEAHATDDSGNVSISSSVSVNIVAGAVPQVEITSPSSGSGLLLGDFLVVTITATDVDDAIALVEVFNLNTDGEPESLGVASATSVANVYQLALTPADAGSLQLEARATDTVGNLNASLPVLVSVTSGEAPTVEITNPLDGDTVVRGSLLQINMLASDNDGAVTQVEVYSGNVLLGLAELSGTGSYRYFHSANQPGLLDLNARATDDRGNVSISDVVAVTVATGDIPTVAITSPADGDSYIADEVITIDVTAEDTDGQVISVAIYDGATEIGLASKVSDTEYRLNLSTSLADVGLLELSARATDDSGNVSISDLATVTVVTGAVPTVAITLPDGDFYTAGDVITIDVTAADTDGQVTSVAIYDGADPIGTASKVSATEYRLQLTTTIDDVGVLYLEARATDDSGNVSISDIVTVTVEELIFAVTFIDPTENPLVLRSTISLIEQAFTVEITAVAAADIQSVQWYYADEWVAESTIDSASFEYTQTLDLAKTGELKVKVTDSSGISVEATMSVIVSINIETPLNSDEAFVRDAYVRLTANTPTDTYVANAVAQMDGTVDGQVAYLEELFGSRDIDETEQVLMVYRTMTGEWPDATELAAARAGLLGGTVAAAAGDGRIETGVPQQTFEFFYNAGDAVTVSVTGAGDDPLSDPTLTINSPSGVEVADDDDGGLGLNPLVNFIAPETGTYSAIVTAYRNQRGGDFTISSSATNLGGSNNPSLQALVISLIQEFEARFDLTFPISTVTPSTEATDLVNQLFKVKHGVNPSPQATVRLKESLTGSGSGSWPGYSGNLTAFTVAFALDNSRSSIDQAYSRVHYYQIPNQAFGDVPLALMIAMFLGEDPTDQALAAYAGMSQAQAFESILTDSRYYEQFPPTGVESFMNSALADLGVFDQSLNGPANDADDDGVSNLMEIALGSDPSDPSDTIVPMATDLEGTEFVITFIRIKASEVPGDFIISLECSEDLNVWDAAADTASVTSTEGVIQDGVPEGYERVEIRIDTNERDCGFFRLSVDLP